MARARRRGGDPADGTAASMTGYLSRGDDRLLLGAAMAVAVGCLGYLVLRDPDVGPTMILGVELAGSVEGIERLIDGQVDGFRRELVADGSLIAGYVTAFALGGIVALRTQRRRWLGLATIVAGVGAGVLDVLENRALGTVLECLAEEGCEGASAAAVGARDLALAKFTLVAVAFVAVGVTLWRHWSPRRRAH
jgi:hypothetical protein